METIGSIIVPMYMGSLLLLALFGIHRYSLLFLYLRNKDPVQDRAFDPLNAPVVTVQLPIYNERYVVDRLVRSVASMRYPKGLLEIQILDDSTDETAVLLKDLTKELRSEGHDVVYLHRTDRSGFKAGALQAGLQVARGKLIAVFDADFTPDPGFFERVVPHFVDEKIGMVQTRWAHINRNHSVLTRVQSMLLDGHFVIEHTARFRTGRFFNFNGTAGVWRRETIEDSGGWQHDTLTEDLDLSYRAQLRGWKFQYLVDVTSPAELPVEMNAYKSQQHRWAKGSIQTAIKLLPKIWASKFPFKAKLEATIHLASNIAYALMLIPVFLMLPVLLLQGGKESSTVLFFYMLVFLASTLSVIIFYLFAEHRATGKVLRHVKYLPCLMSVGIGMSLNNARAVAEALARKSTPFLRTPKYNVVERGAGWKKMSYRAGVSMLSILEVLLAVYFLVSIYFAIASKLFLAVPVLLLFLFGFLYVGCLSLWQRS